MRIYLDCWSCFLRQALSAARRAGAKPQLQREILLETLEGLRALSAQATPPEIGERIHRLVRERTQDTDPCLESKQAATAEALALLPALRRRRTGSRRPCTLPSPATSSTTASPKASTSARPWSAC